MLISVIIPVYQGRNSLEKCLRSIPVEYCSQTEILLVDDGSTDGSAELCDMLAEGRENVYAFHQANQGVAMARNLGMQKARGKYLMFLDVDDQFVPQKWPLIISYAEKKFDFAAFSYYSWFPNGSLLEEPFPNKYTNCGHDELMEVLLGTPLLHTCWGKLFLKDLVDKHHICFPPGVSIGEDYIFVMEYCKYVQTQILINDCVVMYFQNPTGAMGNFNFENRMNCLELLWNYCKAYVEDDSRAKYHDVMCEYQLLAMFSIIRFLAEHVKWPNRYRFIKKMLNANAVREIIEAASKDELSGYRKIEYVLVQRKMAFCAAFYFSLKAVLVKARKGIKR